MATVTPLLPGEPLTSGGWMVAIMYGVLVLWTVTLVVFLGALVKRYTLFDPRVWTRETHPFAAETLAMPRGVFRAVITVSLLIFVLFMEVVSLSRGGLEQHIEQLLTAFQMMLAFYFGGKVMHHLAAVDKRKEQARQETERLLATASPAPSREFDMPGAEG